MHATTTRITMNKNKCKYTECESPPRYTYETCAKEKKEKKKEEKEKRKRIKEKKTSSNKILPLYIKII